MKNLKKSIHYDKQSDALYLGIHKGLEEEFIEILPGVSVEVNKNGRVIGVEVLNASKLLKPVLNAPSRQAVRTY